MIDRGDEELLPWECMYNYDGAVNRAVARLGEIEASEGVMGYAESAQMYHDTANELRDSRPWFHQQFTDAIKSVDCNA